MKGLFFTVLIPILTFNSIEIKAQGNIKIDSLKRVLAKEATDTVTVKKYVAFANQKLQVKNHDARIVIMDWVLGTTIKNNDFLLQSKVYFWKGSYYMAVGDHQNAVANFTKCLDFSHKMGFELMENKALLAIGTFYYANQQYEKAIPMFQEGIKVAKRLNNLVDLGSAYISLSNAIFDATENSPMPKFDEVIHYRKLAIEIAEKTKDTVRLIKTYTSIGTTYNLKKDYTSSDNYFAKAAALLSQSNYDHLNYFYYSNKAEVDRSRGNINAAIENNLKALETFKKDPNPFVEYQVQYNLAQLYAEASNYQKAYELYSKYTTLYDSVQNIEKYKVSAELENKYQQAIKDKEIASLSADQKIKQLELEKQKAIIAGNFSEAKRKEDEIKLLSQEKELQDLQLLQQAEVLSKNKLQAKADSQQIQLGRQEALLQEKQISNQKRTRNYLVGGLGLLGLLAFVLYRNITAKKKSYKVLQEKSEQIKEQALQLSKQAKQIAQFQSQMNPHFVYNALHNIQGLVLTDEKNKANSQIQSLAQLMRKTFANADKDDIPLEEEINYLQKYIEFEKTAFGNNLDFKVQVAKEAVGAMIPPMMIQPFIENAIKHAELKKVINPYIKVLIETENNLLAINITDNGTGIKKEATEGDKLSHSLSVIKSRLDLLFKGRADVNSIPIFSVRTMPEISEGTSVKFYLPLNYSY